MQQPHMQGQRASYTIGDMVDSRAAGAPWYVGEVDNAEVRYFTAGLLSLSFK